jgi:molybdopterin biosynthesis enzyme
VLSKNHRLAAHKEIKPQDLAETYITPTRVAPVLKSVIDGYAVKSAITSKPEYGAEFLRQHLNPP